MGSVRKRAKLLVSHQLPNNTILSIEFGTEMEEDDVDPKVLFEKVMQSLFDDVQDSINKYPMVKSGMKALNVGLKREKKLEQAEKEDD